ncbi:MAG: hypothetical protein ACTHWF_11745 [Brachybacterium sp.]
MNANVVWEPWPTAPDAPAGLLRPGAAVLGICHEGELGAVLRRWVGDGSRWFTRWPDDDPSEAQAPSMFFGRASSTDTAEAWFEMTGVDGQDQVLARAAIAPGEELRWLDEPPVGPLGAVTAGLAELTARAFGPGAAPQLRDGEVLALPGPELPGLAEDLRQRSWHVRDHRGSAGDSMLRALEMPPLRDPEEGTLRARRAHLVHSSAPLSAPGLMVWRTGGVRLWRGGMHPLLDAPVTRSDLTEAESLLAEHVAGEPFADA